jgi:multimeric flavodoxin WrbA
MVNSLLILFHSQQYGHTEEMAKAIKEGAESKGITVTLFNTNERRFSIENYRSFKGVAFGTPDYFSYLAGGIKMFIDDLYIAKKTNDKDLENKIYALFYSHGGGGRVKEIFESLFEKLDIGNKIGKTIESVGKPNDRVIASCKELGKKLADAIIKS